MRFLVLVPLVVLSVGCGGSEEPDPPVLLDVTIVDSGDRFQTPYRLANGKLTRIAGGFGPRARRRRGATVARRR